MITITQGYSLEDFRAASMFADRKRLFVDLMGWKLPVLGGLYEIDQFDGDHASYIIDTDGHGRHAGSMRLLPSERPHILGDLFADLCDADVPRGAHVMEITRLCLPARLGAAGRLALRNRLISAMVDHSLESGVSVLTGITSASFLQQICAMGWRCRSLGATRFVEGDLVAAFRIDLDADTRAQLTVNGISSPGMIAHATCRAA